MTIYQIPPMTYTCPLGTVELPALKICLDDMFTSMFLAHLDSYEELGRRLIARNVEDDVDLGLHVHYLCYTLPYWFRYAYVVSGFSRKGRKGLESLDDLWVHHTGSEIVQTLDDNGDPIRFAMRNAWCKWMARHIREQDNDR